MRCSARRSACSSILLPLIAPPSLLASTAPSSLRPQYGAGTIEAASGATVGRSAELVIGRERVYEERGGDVSMRRDVAFDAEGVTLRGWLYTPDSAAAPFPTVVMAHGFSAVKEMYLDRFAEAFAEAGLAALVFDNRNFGASDGTPRQEIDPWAQVRDYRHAITYARTLPEVDRGLGFQLQRWSRAGGGSDRPEGPVRGLPSSPG